MIGLIGNMLEIIDNWNCVCMYVGKYWIGKGK